MGATAATSLGAGVVALLIVAAVVEGARPPVRSPAIVPAPSPAGLRHERRRTTFPLSIERARQRRRAGRPVPPESVAAWCDAIARRLRTGDTLRQVLGHERPTHVALLANTEPLRRSLARGESVIDAVAASAAASSDAALEMVWAVLAVSVDYGGSAATPIDRAASALRLRSADAHERTAQSAQSRLSAHVLTAVPLLVLTLLVATDPDVRLVVARPAGVSLVAAGLLLNLSGWAWMRRIVARQAR